MAADDYWKRIIADAVDEFVEQVEKNLHYIYDYVLPSLTERGSPDERSAFFSTLDFTALRDPETGDPYLWRKLTDDALTLAEHERESFEQDRAFTNEVRERPVFGLDEREQERMGLRDILQLGRFG